MYLPDIHLPDAIIDLALMLIVASITSLIFKKIKQPLVLGYIVAGLLIGIAPRILPESINMTSIQNMEAIEIWAEIGIICIMFAHGLEFSFHKLVNVGRTAIITSLTKVLGLSVLGFLVGQLLGWGIIDSLVLGAMLSMPSTIIILKTFEELKLHNQIFTKIVSGTLVMVDIVGVFMLIIMSTYAHNISSGELAATIAQLLLYLVLWLILGIYVIPSLLKRSQSFMNDEALLIVSLGVCFGIALLFSNIGLSVALGAFIAGSILAGTVFSERIEYLLKPIKDLFAAVFFIYVGMLVDPVAIGRYALPIILITIVTIIGKFLFTSIGVVLSGQWLITAVHSGASLSQIGEFAFIIATIGGGLGLINEFLYPIIVSVSVITTFTTPYFIKNAERIYNLIKRIVPDKLHDDQNANPYGSWSDDKESSYWKWFFTKHFIDIIVKVIIPFGILQLSIFFIDPFIGRFIPSIGGKLLTVSITLLCMTPFLGTLLHQRKTNHLTSILFFIFRIAITIFILVFTVIRFLDVTWIWIIFPILIIIAIISRSDWVIGRHLHIRARFLANFFEKSLFESADTDIIYDPNYGWISEQLWVEEYYIGNELENRIITLKDLKLEHDYHVIIIKVISGNKHYNTPDSNLKIRANDIIYLMGEKDRLNMFGSAFAKNYNWLNRIKEAIMLRSFIVSSDNEHGEYRLFCCAIHIEKGQIFEGKNITSSKIEPGFGCNIIGIQRNNFHIIYPDSKFILSAGDQLWLLGDYQMVGKLIIDDLIQTDKHELTDAVDGRR